MPEPCTVLLGGVATRLQTEDPLLAAALADALGTCPPTAAPPELAITDGPEPALPAGEPDEEYGPVRIWRRKDLLHLAWGSVLTARAEQRSVVLTRTVSPPNEVARAVRQILPYVMGHLLDGPARVVLHAGALLMDGGAIVVLGPTGAGKSTLVFAARSAGHAVLSDDLVVVTLRDGDLEVTGIPRPLALAADDASGLPGEARAIGDDARGRWQFPLEGVHGSHPVHAVVVVEHGTEPAGHVEPLPGSDVWDAVLGSYFSATDPGRLRAGLPVLAAVSRRPGWRLGHGSDPVTRHAVAARLLDTIEASLV